MELLMEETGTRLRSTHVIGEDLPGREKKTPPHTHTQAHGMDVWGVVGP